MLWGRSLIGPDWSWFDSLMNWVKSFFEKMNFWKMSYDMQWHWDLVTSMSLIASPQELHVYGIPAISIPCITLRLCLLKILSKKLAEKIRRKIGSYVKYMVDRKFRLVINCPKIRKILTFSSWSNSWIISNSFNNHFYTVSFILLWNTGFWLAYQTYESRYP